MRLFLAIDLPRDVKKKLHAQLKPIHEDYGDVRWVTEENFHITLIFFGEVQKPDKIIKKIQDALFDIPSFYLYSSQVDLFIKDKITIYLGFQRNKILEKLVDQIKEEVAIKSTKKFIPHLTLGRYRIPSKQQYFLMKKKLRKMDVDIDFKTSKLVLFDSILPSPKPIYKTIASFPLLEKP